jgi:acyl-CoA synthetase (AMP-forming)/AMP-acid ligase II
VSTESNPHPGDDAAGDNLSSLLFAHPCPDDEPLLHTVARTVGAGEARAEAAQVAERLRAAGVSPGDAVAVRLPNAPEVVTAMAGIWRAGAVFVPVNPRATDAEWAHVRQAAGPSVLLGPTFLTGAEPARVADAAEGVGAGGRYGPGAAFVLWTSGTTGAPKPIVHTHHGYLELLDRVLGPLRGVPTAASDAPRRPPSPNLIPVSMALNAGIYNALFGLRAGAPLVIMDGFDTTTFAVLVQRFAIRSTVLPPAAIAMLCDDDSVTTLGELKYVRSITAPLSPVQARRFTDKFGTFVLNSYGQAEVGEVIGWTAADARAHPDKLGAAGRPHPGVAVRLVEHTPDGDERAVGPGGVGELLVRPPAMAAGYASGAELADRLTADGFVRTGDLARMDDDGFVWLEGRLGDLINRGGNKVFPEQVEEVLRLSPAVAEAAVVGVPDDRLGEVPVAFVVPTAGSAGTGALTAAALADLCRRHLTPYKVPVAFEVVASLPRNEAGKVLRRQLVPSGRVTAGGDREPT